jgi:DNA-binding GntR family transcriptional regulator
MTTVHDVYTDTTGNKRGSAKQQAYEQIKQLILTRAGSEAEFLGEESLAAELGVSRTPVREAFLRLEAERLLQLVPGKGAFIPTVTEAEVAHVIEVRTLLEVFAGRHLASERTREGEDRIQRLREAHQAQKETLGREPEAVAEFIALDREFHREIIAASDNPVLLDLYERLRDRELRMDVQAHRRNPGRLAEAHREHGLILKALAGGDADIAEQAIRTHLRHTSLALR